MIRIKFGLSIIFRFISIDIGLFKISDTLKLIDWRKNKKFGEWARDLFMHDSGTCLGTQNSNLVV